MYALKWTSMFWLWENSSLEGIGMVWSMRVSIEFAQPMDAMDTSQDTAKFKLLLVRGINIIR